tara:strand:+ start:2522 stop:2893 length:372 start_codon:yes stop_codon:yes gene_type:complete
MEKYIDALTRCNFKEMQPFGSRVVGCAKEDSDYDYLVLVPQRPSFENLEGTGFIPDAEDPLYGLDFSSWKKGKINLVFTTSKGYFDATIKACSFCKTYKVYDKTERCALHETYRNAAKWIDTH